LLYCTIATQQECYYDDDGRKRHHENEEKYKRSTEKKDSVSLQQCIFAHTKNMIFLYLEAIKTATNELHKRRRRAFHFCIDAVIHQQKDQHAKQKKHSSVFLVVLF
jgi:hypothetical protein